MVTKTSGTWGPILSISQHSTKTGAGTGTFRNLGQCCNVKSNSLLLFLLEPRAYRVAAMLISLELNQMYWLRKLSYLEFSHLSLMQYKL